ncbi:MAG: universal stress protein [Spirochaetes bacterium]|nr:universal stress protein [Spirochaetota bacterium]
MFKKILYPTDFSECAQAAIPYIKSMKKIGTKDLIILHVIDIRQSTIIDTTAFGETFIYPYDIGDILKKEAQAQMTKLIKQFSKLYRVTPLIIEGIPFREIIQIAQEHNVSCIVLGSHGKSNIEEMLLGSVTEKVVRKSTIPCLVIKRA